ncbi:platelet glycoprotein IX-like [Oculina patagonica]
MAFDGAVGEYEEFMKHAREDTKMPSWKSVWALVIIIAALIVEISLQDTTKEDKKTCPEPCRCTPWQMSWSPNLEEVKCRKKALTAVPRHLPANTGLLDVSKNQLEYLPAGVFDNLTNLEIL